TLRQTPANLPPDLRPQVREPVRAAGLLAHVHAHDLHPAQTGIVPEFTDHAEPDTDAVDLHAGRAGLPDRMPDQRRDLLRAVRMRPPLPARHNPAPLTDHRLVAATADVHTQLHRQQDIGRMRLLGCDTARGHVAAPDDLPFGVLAELPEDLAAVQRV